MIYANTYSTIDNLYQRLEIAELAMEHCQADQREFWARKASELSALIDIWKEKTTATTEGDAA